MNVTDLNSEIEEAKRNLGVNGSNHKGTETRAKNTNSAPAYSLTEVDKAAREMLYDKRRAKAFMKRQTPEVLHWLIDAAQEVLPEVKERIEREREEAIAAKKFDLIAELAAKASEIGLSLDEVLSEVKTGKITPPKTAISTAKITTSDGKQRSRKQIAHSENMKKACKVARFKYEIFGREYLWSGMGHLPKPFKCWLAKGNDKEAARVPDTEQIEIPKAYKSNEIPAKFETAAKKLLNTYVREIESKK